MIVYDNPQFLMNNDSKVILLAYLNQDRNGKSVSDGKFLNRPMPLKENINDAIEMFNKCLQQIEKIRIVMLDLNNICKNPPTQFNIQVKALISKIDNLANEQVYNGLKLFSGDYYSSMSLVIQTDCCWNNVVRINIEGLTSPHLGLMKDNKIMIDLSDKKSIKKSKDIIISALNMIKYSQKRIESYQERMRYILQHLMILEKYKFQPDKLEIERDQDFIMTAKDSLGITKELLTRIMTLLNKTVTQKYKDEKIFFQMEVSELINEVDRISSSTAYNHMTLLTGRFANSVYGGFPMASMWFQAGNNTDNKIRLYLGTFSSMGLGIRNNDINGQVLSPGIESCNTALKKIEQEQVSLQSLYNRLKFVQEINNKQKDIEFTGEIPTLKMCKLFLKTADDSLDEMEKIIEKLRTLTVKAIQESQDKDKFLYYQIEVSQLINEIDRIASCTEFNRITLLTGRFTDPSQGGFPTASMWVHYQQENNKRQCVYIATMTSYAFGLRKYFPYYSYNKVELKSSKLPEIKIKLDNALLKIKRQKDILKKHDQNIVYQDKPESKQEVILLNEKNFSLLNEGVDTLTEIKAALEKIQSLVVKCANSTYSDTWRTSVKKELEDLVSKIDETAENAKYNNMNLLTGRFVNPLSGGSPTASMWFQVGLDVDQSFQVYIGTTTSMALGIPKTYLFNKDKNLDIINPDKAGRILPYLCSALIKIEKIVTDLKAYQVRLKYSFEHNRIMKVTSPEKAGDQFEKKKLLLQRAEGSLEISMRILQRLWGLAVKAADGSYTQEGRMFIQVEVSQLIAEIDRIAYNTEFNRITLLTGKFVNPGWVETPTSSMWFHIGNNANEKMQIYMGTMTGTGLGIKSEWTYLSVLTPEHANRTIGQIDQALWKINDQRKLLLVYQTRLFYSQKFNKLMEKFDSLSYINSNQKNILCLNKAADALEICQDILMRLKELAWNASDSIYTINYRMNFQIEVSALLMEFDHIIKQTEFEQAALFTGRFADKPWGTTDKTGDKLYFKSMELAALNLNNLSISTPEMACSSFLNIEKAIGKITEERKKIAGYLKKLPESNNLLVKEEMPPEINEKDFQVMKGFKLSTKGIQDYLFKIREIAINAVDGAHNSEDRMDFQKEIESYLVKIKEVIDTAKYKQWNVLKGEKIDLTAPGKQQLPLQMKPICPEKILENLKLTPGESIRLLVKIIDEELSKTEYNETLIEVCQKRYQYRQQFSQIISDTVPDKKDTAEMKDHKLKKRIAGLLDCLQDELKVIRKACVCSADGFLNMGQREMLQVQVDSFVEEIEYILMNSEYNGKKLFDGDFNWKNKIIEQVNLKDIGLVAFAGKAISIKTENTANDSLLTINNCINKIRKLQRMINEE